jgi:hypothetical protein
MLVAMAAGQRDRPHFAAIAAASAASDDEAIDRAVATPPGERMLAGEALGAAMPVTPALLAELDAQADGQMELARRRVALGLRRDLAAG